MAVVFLHERLRLWGWIGILLSFLGVALFSVKPDKGFALSPSAVMVLALPVSGAGGCIWGCFLRA
ncbi:MAG: hypothetical protein M1482_01825, partial [Chloroflexi bacterium]|nr:hypothetical protein [Chloroflexota bacterium]